ncbi:hypothetical protein ACIB24_22345 [Spongisporangium articulatum]|uniref:Uncharacterized protein n=1 Tax=Spongisporangium articulatum TaxID=3362603 RepID=A0ABW8ATX7_9ACTN
MIDSRNQREDAGPSEPPARLVTEWAAYGIVVAAARFVPVPLVDDLVRDRATRLAVSRTLKAHGRGYGVSQIEPVYGGAEGTAHQVRRYVASIPRRVLLFPVRKYVALFGSVKGVPSDVLATVLLARTLHRHLARGGLPEAAPEKAREAEARRLRRAYDAALEELDLKVLTGALGESLSRGRDLTGAAVKAARRLVRREDDDPVDDDRTVGAAAEGVAGVLSRHELAPAVAEFDARVDARYAELPER